MTRLHPDDIRAIARAVVAELARGLASAESARDARMWLSPKELSSELRVSLGLLRNWRRSGVGPRFSRFGERVRYLRADVAVWMRSVRAKRAHRT